MTVLAFGLMIAIHELGHFIVARLCGVAVEKFSVGFGTALAHFTRDGIEYRIGWIPLGGYVKMKGEDPDSEHYDADSFLNQAWWKKALIAVSGPLANLILGIILFILAYLLPMKVEDHHPVVAKLSPYLEQYFAIGDSLVSVNGEPVKGWYHGLGLLKRDDANSLSILRSGEKVDIDLQATEADSLIFGAMPLVLPVVGDLQTGMPAWKAGLKSGDKILAIDSVEVQDWYKMRELIVNAGSDSIRLTLERDGEVFYRSMYMERSFLTDNLPMIGITQYMPLKYGYRYSVSEAGRNGVMASSAFVITNYKGLFHLIRRPEELKSSLGGPVMIMSMSQQVGKKGIGYLVLFFGSISLILMVMNLLPIPILDGGLILFAFIEGIVGKPLPTKVQAFLQRLGFALLILLMIYAFYNDLGKLASRFLNR